LGAGRKRGANRHSRWSKETVEGESQTLLNRLRFLYFIQRKGWLNRDRQYLVNHFLYSQLDSRGGQATEHGLLLHAGIAGLQNHIVNQPFRRDEARTAAARAACAAAWIQRQPANVTIESLRFRAARQSRISSSFKPF
jgi:hypothetical protein